MPDLTDTDHRVLAYVASWYRTGRGALPVQRVAEATGVGVEQVEGSACVLAAAGRVRTYRPRPGGGDLRFVGVVDCRPRVVDLRAHATWRAAHA